ncbi:MAG: SPOR domain-containing protein [Pseudomonadales bacterium]|nr:SPOR domain-containing protein [Pseudomonadales bacterium]
MPRDYSRSRRKTERRSGPFIHGPSLVFGILIGAAGVLAGAYGPEWLDKQPAKVAAKPAEEKKPEITFHYPDRLKKNEVEVDPATYAPPEPVRTEPKSFILQAGSFRTAADAETVRASLLLQDLPVTMVPVKLADGQWYRVMVGPYSSRSSAEATANKLRAQKLQVTMSAADA